MFLSPTGVYLSLSFIFGSCIGSFLNVVIYRLPAGISLLWPPSHCPHCQHRLSPTENVPVLGWLWLRGRCRHCHTPISPRYPLVEAMTGGIFVVIASQLGFSPWVLAYWCFASWLIILAFIDWDTLTLPNSLTQSGLVLGLVMRLTLGFWATGLWAGGLRAWMVGVVGAVVGLWVFEGLGFGASVMLRRSALGGGDMKLAAMIGAWLGWQHVLLVLFLAASLGAILGSILELRRRYQDDRVLPFGPFLAVAAILSSLWGQTWLNLYWNWLT